MINYFSSLQMGKFSIRGLKFLISISALSVQRVKLKCALDVELNNM